MSVDVSRVHIHVKSMICSTKINVKAYQIVFADQQQKAVGHVAQLYD